MKLILIALLIMLPILADAQRIKVQPLTEEQFDRVSDYLKGVQKELHPEKKHAFYIQSEEDAFKNTFFVPAAGDYSGTGPKLRDWRGHISLLLIGEDSGRIRELPKHPAHEWLPFDVQAVAFRDLNEDGKTDIFVNVSATTGIGPEGARPFDSFAAYIQNQDGKFELVSELQARLEKEYVNCIQKSCRSLAHMMQLTRDYFKNR